MISWLKATLPNFNPRPPRGGRPKRRPSLTSKSKFQSTPSARRATTRRAGRNHRTAISIHALREEGDLIEKEQTRAEGISIHALREEGDYPAVRSEGCVSLFQSTPSARRATWLASTAAMVRWISIHALREEGDSKSGEKIHHVCSIIHTCAQFEKELYEGSGEMQNKSC